LRFDRGGQITGQDWQPILDDHNPIGNMNRWGLLRQLYRGLCEQLKPGLNCRQI